MLRRLHKLIFLAVAAWMLLAPAYVQVFGQRSTVAHAWRMYHRVGVGRCAALYDVNGARIDRYALLEQARRDAPESFRRIASVAEAREMGERLCARLRELRAGTAPDVRVRLRCGVEQGMTTLLDREENLCGG